MLTSLYTRRLGDTVDDAISLDPVFIIDPDNGVLLLQTKPNNPVPVPRTGGTWRQRFNRAREFAARADFLAQAYMTGTCDSRLFDAAEAYVVSAQADTDSVKILGLTLILGWYLKRARTSLSSASFFRLTYCNFAGM